MRTWLDEFREQQSQSSTSVQSGASGTGTWLDEFRKNQPEPSAEAVNKQKRIWQQQVAKEANRTTVQIPTGHQQTYQQPTYQQPDRLRPTQTVQPVSEESKNKPKTIAEGRNPLVDSPTISKSLGYQPVDIDGDGSADVAYPTTRLAKDRTERMAQEILENATAPKRKTNPLTGNQLPLYNRTTSVDADGDGRPDYTVEGTPLSWKRQEEMDEKVDKAIDSLLPNFDPVVRHYRGKRYEGRELYQRVVAHEAGITDSERYDKNLENMQGLENMSAELQEQIDSANQNIIIFQQKVEEYEDSDLPRYYENGEPVEDYKKWLDEVAAWENTCKELEQQLSAVKQKIEYQKILISANEAAFNQVIAAVPYARDFEKKSKPVEAREDHTDDDSIEDAYYILALFHEAGDDGVALARGMVSAEHPNTISIRGNTISEASLIYMTDKEREVFCYLYNTGEKDAAEFFLGELLPYILQREGQKIAELADIPVLRETYAFLSGAASGVQNTIYGVGSLFADIDAPNATANDYAMQALLGKNDGSLAYYTTAAAQNIGNMTPMVAANLINPSFGSAVMFATARGSAYIEAKNRGASHGEAWMYGTMVGASEAFLERLLGLGGGVVQGAIPKNLASKLTTRLNNKYAKLAAQFAVNLAGEEVEENLQNYLDPAFAVIAGLEDNYNAPGYEDFLETTIVTALTTAFFSGVRAKTDFQRIEYDNQIRDTGKAYLESEDPIVRNLGQQLLDLENRLKVGDHISPEEVRQLYSEAVAKAEERMALENTQQRAEMVQENNPDAEVINSHGAQLYLNNGAPLSVAQEAGAIIDRILSGEITSENLSGKQADKLRLNDPYAVKSLSDALGADVQRGKTKSEARKNARKAILAYEQRIKEVATQNNNAQSTVQQNGDNSLVDNKPASQTQETAPVAVPDAQEKSSVPMPAAEAVEQEAPQMKSEQGPVQGEQVIEQDVEHGGEQEDFNALFPSEEETTTAPAGLMSYEDFKYRMRTDKEFRNRYTDAGANGLSQEGRNLRAYDLYQHRMAQMQSAAGTLSSARFAESYRALNETKKTHVQDTEVDLAYQEYLEAQQDGTMTESEQDTVPDDYIGLVEDEVSKAIPEQIRKSVDAIARMFGLQIRYADIGTDNGYYVPGTNRVVLDINPFRQELNDAERSAYLFTVAHEVGHYAREHMSAAAWDSFEAHAITALGGKTAVETKMQEKDENGNSIYYTEDLAREDVACDFLGQILSDEDSLKQFCDAIRAKNVSEASAEGILGAIRHIIQKLKGTKPKGLNSAAVLRSVAPGLEIFAKDVEAGQRAVTEIANALAEIAKQPRPVLSKAQADRLAAERKNSARTGNVRKSKQNAVKHLTLGKQEYRNLQSARMTTYTTYGKMMPDIDGVFANDMFYVVRNYDLADFSVLSRLDPETDSQRIDVIMEALKYESNGEHNASGEIFALLQSERRNSKGGSDSNQRGRIGRQTAGLVRGFERATDRGRNQTASTSNRAGDIRDRGVDHDTNSDNRYSKKDRWSDTANPRKIPTKQEADALLAREQKNAARTGDVRNSVEMPNPYGSVDLSKEKSVYEYSFMKNLPQMDVATMPLLSVVKDGDRISPTKAVDIGMKDAAALGQVMDNGNVVVRNKYTNRGLTINRTALKHSLDGKSSRVRTNARLAAIAGQLVQNAVPINALHNKSKTANGTYAMACLAISGDKNVVVIITVEMRNDEVVGFDSDEIIHAINGRMQKEESSLLATRAQGYQKLAPNATALTISIADFLDIVNTTHQSILSDSVLQHFNEERNPDGHYFSKRKFSIKDRRDETARTAPGAEQRNEMLNESIETIGQLERSTERAIERKTSPQKAQKTLEKTDAEIADATEQTPRKPFGIVNKEKMEAIKRQNEEARVASAQREAETVFFRRVAGTARTQAINDEVRLIRQAERAERRAERITAQYNERIDALKQQVEHNKRQASLESTFRQQAEKENRELNRKVERLRRERDKQVRALQKDAFLFLRTQGSNAAVEAIRKWRRNGKIGRAALAPNEVDTRILTKKEQATLQRETAEGFKAKAKALQNRMNGVSQKLAFYFTSERLPFEEMARLQNRVDSIDTAVLAMDNSKSMTNAILTDSLRAADGSVIDGRSVMEVLGCWVDDKVGGKIDEAKQRLFDRYLYMMHSVDRMSAVKNARANMRKFLTNHPEFATHVKEVMNEDGKASFKDLTLRANEVFAMAVKGDKAAQEFVELAKAFAAAKDKPVFGTADGSKVLGAETSKIIADEIAEANPWVKEKAEEFYAYWDKFMQEWYVGKTGTQEQYDAMKKLYPHYVPTYRAFTNQNSSWSYSPNGIGTKNAVSAAKGSTADLNTVGDNVARQVERLVSVARQAELFSNVYQEVLNGTEGFDAYAAIDPQMVSLDSQETELALFDPYSEDAAPAQHEENAGSLTKNGNVYTWKSYFNGEQRQMLVSDRVYESLLSMTNANKTLNKMAAVGNTVTSPMKTAITGVNVNFAVRNILRDFYTAIVNSVAGSVKFTGYYFEAIAKMVGDSKVASAITSRIMKLTDTSLSETERESIGKELVKCMESARLKGSKEWNDFVALGGTGATRARSETGFLWNKSAKGKIREAKNKTLSVLGAINEFTESIPRFAEYLATIGKYGDTAEGRARGIKNAAEVTVDFSRHGKAGKVLNAYIPYWNPQIQGMAKMYRSIRFPGEGNKMKGSAAWKQRGMVLSRAFVTSVVPGLEIFAKDVEAGQRAVTEIANALAEIAKQPIPVLSKAQADRLAEERKNAARTGDVKSSNKNNTKRSATSPLSGSPATQGSVGMASKPVTAAVDHLGINVNLAHLSDSVKSAISAFSEIVDAIDDGKPVFDGKKIINASNLTGALIKSGVLRRGGSTESAYRTDGNHTLRLSDHSARADNFTTDGENLSVVLLKTNKTNRFSDSDSADVIEVQFKKDYLDRNPEAFKNLVKDMARFVATGEYHDTAGAKNYNISGSETFRTEAASRLADDEKARSVLSKETVRRSSKNIQATNMDSTGKQLSVGQQEYFKNSVVRDDAGNLLVVYHGTDADFTVFDIMRAGKNGRAEGYGFYFSDDQEITKKYGDRQMEVYLNITKPLYSDRRTLTKAELRRFADAVISNEMQTYDMDWRDSFISNYIDTYAAGITRVSAVQRFVNQIWETNENDQDLIYEIANGSGQNYSVESMKRFYATLKDSIGVDGNVSTWHHADGTSNVYVAFSPEQAKNVDNANPTKNPDIRRSAKNNVQSAEEYKKPITAQDVQDLRSIGRKSINEFTADDLKKTQKWAYKFYQELGVKSPFFRAWFGDWRANDKKQITVVNKMNGVPFAAGKASNEDTGRVISWGNQIKTEVHRKYGRESEQYSLLETIHDIVQNAVLFETEVSTLTGNSKMPNTTFMHSLFAIVDNGADFSIVKLLAEESMSGDLTSDFVRGYELQTIEKVAKVKKGVLTENSGLTQHSATINTIADLYDAVKRSGKNNRLSSAKEVNSLLLNDDGTPKVFYHGSKKNGGFTVFRDWQYFTEQRQYAERYAERGNPEAMYAVYLTAAKVFDTRNKDSAEIFENIRQEYGLGELQDTGLPDWTDGYDITEYLSEHPELGYDAVLLDEGGDLVDGEPVSRGFSIVIKDSTQIKSATENIGTFDRTNPDIRRSVKNRQNETANPGKIPTKQEADALLQKRQAEQKAREAKEEARRDAFMRSFVENSPARRKSSKNADLEALVQKHGAIPKGENPVREVDVPNRTNTGTKVRRTVRTALEAKVTPDSLVPVIEDDIVAGNFDYRPKKNQRTVEKAREWLKTHKSAKAAYKAWLSDKSRHLNADMIARGFVLYNTFATAANQTENATERRELQENAIDILHDISVMGTVAGQAAQAIRLLKQQTPDAQYYAIERAVARLQSDINERHGDKKTGAPQIVIDEELAGKWIQALRQGETEKANDLENLLHQSIAAQVPKTFRDRINAWRYLAMLGNPKTLIRNAVGNLAFTPMAVIKDQIGAALERIFLPKEQRTKYAGFRSFTKKGRELLKYADRDIESAEVQQMLSTRKYDDTNVNDRLGRAIAEKKSTFTLPGLKQWQAVTRYVMEKLPFAGDDFYKGIHYKRAFTSAAMARGYTAEDFRSGRVSENERWEIRAYAAKQAMKATFNDANMVSNAVRGLRFKSKEHKALAEGANVLIEGVIPFKGTPANVLVRSVEYGPVGLLKALTADIYSVKTGKITGQEYIDRVSSGLTGTAIAGLGYLLASLGVIRVNADDDDEREGKQTYSLEMFGKSITIDWLSPSAIPLFMGAEINELRNGEGYESFADALIDVSSDFFAPVFEMSMLSGAKDLLDNFVYAYSDGADAGTVIASLFVQPFFSYLGQFLPTLMSQTAKALEPNRTTTYVGDISSKWARSFVRNVVKLTEKIPFVDWRQIDYVDDWGNVESNGGLLERFLNSFINPAYVNDIVVTDVDAEIARIKEENGANIAPERRKAEIVVSVYDDDGKKISSEKVKLNGDQYSKYQREYGKQYALMAASLMVSEYYDDLSDSDKVKAFDEIESLADEFGKLAADVGYVIEPGSNDNKLHTLTELGMPVAEAYAARLMYRQLNGDEELKPTDKYERFRTWVLDNGEWTDEEKTAVIDAFGKFSTGFVVSSESYDELISSGTMDASTASSITEGVRALEPPEGQEDVSDYQKYEYILGRTDLDAEQRDAALIAYLDKEEKEKFEVCAESGVSATTYVQVKVNIHNTKPINGNKNVTDLQKWQVCIKTASNPQQQDALLRNYMSGEQKAKYQEVASAGVSAKAYVDVLTSVFNLNPRYDNKGVTVGQKWEVCVKATGSTKQQDAWLKYYMDNEQEAKYQKARNAGVSPSLYVAFYNGKDTEGDKNGSWSQAELKAWLNANVSSEAQKAVLWELANKNWVPYR